MLQQPRMRRGQGSHGRVAADTRPGRSWTPRPSDAAGRRSWLDGLTDTPGSVFPRRYQHGSSGHPSTDAVADALQQPTRTLGRAALKRALSGLAPGGVYLAFPVTREAGGLLHHRFTLTCSQDRAGTARGRRSILCGTGLRVTPSGRYPPPCSAEPGRSSSHFRDARPPGQPIRCPFYGHRPTAITRSKQVLRWENESRKGSNPLPGSGVLREVNRWISPPSLC